MSVTRRAGSDFSANVGLAVYESAANTIALWTDPTVEPLGIVAIVDEADPQDVTVATQGDRCQVKIAAGDLAAGVGSLTTVGAGGALTAQPFTADGSASWSVARNLHPAAASEDDMVDAIVNIFRAYTPAP